MTYRTYAEVFREEIDAALDRAIKRIDPNVNGDLAGQIFDGSAIVSSMKRQLIEELVESAKYYWDVRAGENS